jgi:hypothetical protein
MKNKYSLRPRLFDALAHFTKTNAPPVDACNSEGINGPCARFSSMGDFFSLCLFIGAGTEPK